MDYFLLPNKNTPSRAEWAGVWCGWKEELSIGYDELHDMNSQFFYPKLRNSNHCVNRKTKGIKDTSLLHEE